MDLAHTGHGEDGVFVAVGINFVYISSDGDNWVHKFTPPTNLYRVAVGEQNVVAVGPKGLAVYSDCY
jgi:hypothetical protein